MDMLRTCIRCSDEFPFIQTDIRPRSHTRQIKKGASQFGNPVYHDDQGRKWGIKWSTLGKIISARCPDCVLERANAARVKIPKSKKRRCNICKKPLPISRRFNHEGCINMRSYHNFDGNFIYNGSCANLDVEEITVEDVKKMAAEDTEFKVLPEDFWEVRNSSSSKNDQDDVKPNKCSTK